MEKKYLIKKPTGVFFLGEIVTESELLKYNSYTAIEIMIKNDFISIEEQKADVTPQPDTYYHIQLDEGFGYLVSKKVYDSNPCEEYSDAWHNYNLIQEFLPHNDAEPVRLNISNEKLFSLKDITAFIDKAEGYNGSPFARKFKKGILENALFSLA